jgi:hypothetical protein
MVARESSELPFKFRQTKEDIMNQVTRLTKVPKNPKDLNRVVNLTHPLFDELFTLCFSKALEFPR